MLALDSTVSSMLYPRMTAILVFRYCRREGKYGYTLRLHGRYFLCLCCCLRSFHFPRGARCDNIPGPEVTVYPLQTRLLLTHGTCDKTSSLTRRIVTAGAAGPFDICMLTLDCLLRNETAIRVMWVYYQLHYIYRVLLALFDHLRTLWSVRAQRHSVRVCCHVVETNAAFTSSKKLPHSHSRVTATATLTQLCTLPPRISSMRPSMITGCIIANELRRRQRRRNQIDTAKADDPDPDPAQRKLLPVQTFEGILTRSGSPEHRPRWRKPHQGASGIVTDERDRRKSKSCGHAVDSTRAAPGK